MIVLLDNRDSFVYNLVDALHTTTQDYQVFRNNVPLKRIIEADPSLIILSPGPGHPRDAGVMMELIDYAWGRIPMLGICLGFQGMLEHCGGRVYECGPMHGVTGTMRLTKEGASSPLFEGMPDEVPVARYHSLGCSIVPSGLVTLGWGASTTGEVVMAAQSDDCMSIGLQFHPESVLSPTGPAIINNAIAFLQRSH